MSSLKQQIMDSIVQPHANNSFDTVKAEVIEYDNIRNRAIISYQDPKGPGMMEADNVPVQLGSGGVHSAGPFPGDDVIVSFQNKSPLQPKIVALSDEGYEYRTRERSRHSRKGAFIPDSVCRRESYGQEVDISKLTPAVDDWFDNQNTNEYKYKSFEEVDPINSMAQDLSGLSYYGSEEPGITHPLNSSTIKIRNNGMIDLFVSTNHGIRIDPKTRTINIMGNSERHHINDFSVYADEFVNVGAQKDVSIEAKNNLSLRAKETSVEANSLDIQLKEWTVTSEGDITVRGKQNITLESQEDVIIKGKRVVIDGELITDRERIVNIINEGEKDG